MIVATDAVEVYCLRATGLVAGKGQLFLPYQGVNQAGLANITAP